MAAATLLSGVEHRHSAPALPTNEDGSLKFHEVVLINPKSATHGSKEWWCKVAAYAEFVLIGIIACTGFVLTALYAPAFIPTVSILIVFCLFGADKLHKVFMGWAGHFAKECQEDTHVEGLLKQWEKETFPEVLESYRDFLKEHIDTTPEEILNLHKLSGRDELDQLKTLFARHCYQHTVYLAAAANLDAKEKELREKKDELDEKNTEIADAISRGKLDLSALRREQLIINSDFQQIQHDRYVLLDEMAHAKANCALYLYLLRNPLNTVNPDISPLTWRSIFQGPVETQEGEPAFLDRHYLRLPFGMHITIKETLENPTRDLAVLINKQVKSHLEAAERSALQRAAEAETV